MDELDRQVKEALLSEREFKEELKKIQRTVGKLIALTRPRSVMPMVHLIWRQDKELKHDVVGLSMPFNDSSERQQITETLGKVYHGDGKLVVALFMVSEAWLAETTLEDKRPPSEHPDRKEIVQVAGSALGLGSLLDMVSFATVRRLKKNRITLEGWQDMAGAECRLLRHFWRGFFGKTLASLN